MYKDISDLIEAGNYKEASACLISHMETDGFNDTLAIFAATISAYYGDDKGCISNIDAGLSHNASNYELHLMRGNYYAESNVPAAYDEYELAIAYCKHEKGAESADYAYLKDVYNDFCSTKYDLIREYESSLPILIYKSDKELCYGILDHFAECMAKELISLGERVEIIDINENPPQEFLPKLTGKRYKAILGVQSFVFSVQYTDGRIIHDHIFGPKYNMLFDHPACMIKHFSHSPERFYVLTHDRNYVEYIIKYYPEISGAYILPPAGEEYKKDEKKEYGLSFLGTYHDPKRWKAEIDKLDEEYSGKVTKLIDYMINFPNTPFENAVRDTFGADSKRDLFFELKSTYFYVMSIYREEILKTILDAGIIMEVFGDCWKSDKWSKYENLHIHEQIDPNDATRMFKKSKASLNIMSWHKDGRTERIANMMLNNCVAVTDSCRYLSERYEDGSDIVLFDLADFKNLPDRIKELLDNTEKSSNMAKKAYNKALNDDTWKERAKEYIELIAHEH